MNKSKKLSILLGVLVVLCTATFAIMHHEEEVERIRCGGVTILAVPPEDVSTFSWSHGEETLSFHRDNTGTWHWDEDNAFPVNENAMEQYLEKFKNFAVTFIIEDVTDFNQYGLTEPKCTIRFTTEESEYTIFLGDYSKMDSQRYVSIGDGNAYLVGIDPLEDFQVTIRDMIQNDSVPDYDQVTSVQFHGLVDYTIDYEKESTKSYCDDDVYFTDELPLDTTQVNSYLYDIEHLSLTNYATYNATQKELESFGMVDPELTVSVNYITDAEDVTGSFTIYISRDPAAVQKAEAAEDEDIDIPCYLRINNSPIVYEISQTLYDTLSKASYNDLRHRDLLPADFADITQIDIHLGGEDYTLTTALEEISEDGEVTVATPKDGEIHWYYHGEEITIDKLKSAISRLRADSFTDEMPEGEEEVSVVFYLDNENFPTVSLELYRNDGTSCLAVVDGNPTALVTRSSVVDFTESILAIVLG